MRAHTTRRMGPGDAAAQGSKLTTRQFDRYGLRVNSHVLARRRAAAEFRSGMLSLARSLFGVDR
jgi:hypothetical protein